MRFWKRLKWWHLGAAVLVAIVVWFVSLRDDLALLREQIASLSNAFCDEDDECTATGDEEVSNVPFDELHKTLVGWVPDVFAPKLFPVESSLQVHAGPGVTMTWPARCGQGEVLTGGLVMQGAGTLTVRVETAFPCIGENGEPIAGKVQMCTQELTTGMSTGLAVTSEGRTVLTMNCNGNASCGVTLGRGSPGLPGKAKCECVDRVPDCK